MFCAALMPVLAACGFTPIYKMDNARAAPQLRALTVTGGAEAQLLEDALRGRWEKTANAPVALVLKVTTTQRNLQVDASGLAERFEIEVRVTAQLVDAARNEATGFQLHERQTLARQDSAADELRQQQIITELAVSQLAERLLLDLPRRLKETEQ